MSDPTKYAPEGPLDSTPTGRFTKPSDRRIAFASALHGVELGKYDEKIVRWLCDLDDPTCRTLVSLMWRARKAERTIALDIAKGKS